MKGFGKKILAFALIGALTVSSILSVSCHGKKYDGEYTPNTRYDVPKDFDTSKTYEITFWAKNDSNLTQVQIYEDAIRSFEAIYPNIKVNLKKYTDYGKIYQDVITNISTDTTPNVCITYPDHIATYLSGKDTVVPLDTFMADEKYGFGGSEVRFDGISSDETIEKFMAECRIDGTQYALPFMRSTEACYVNKTFVEALGYELPEVLTWDFIWEVSDAAMAKNEDGTFKVNGQNVLIPFIYKSTDNMMIQMLRQRDAGYSTDEGVIEIFNDTTKGILLEIYEHSAKKSFNTFGSIGYPANYLNRGQCIFAIDSTAGATWMGSDAPLIDIPDEDIVNFETEVMMIPQYDPEDPKMISQGPSVCIFNKDDSQEVLASWLFAQFMLTNEVQLAYSQTEGYVPVTRKAQESDEYIDYLSRVGENGDFYYDIKIEATRLLLDNIDHTFVTPVFRNSASLRNAAGQMIESTARAGRQQSGIDDEYIEDLYDEMVSRYKLDRVRGSMTLSVFLLVSLGITWTLILTYAVIKLEKKRKYKQKN